LLKVYHYNLDSRFSLHENKSLFLGCFGEIEENLKNEEALDPPPQGRDVKM
jgi:hypothetical protein